MDPAQFRELMGRFATGAFVLISLIGIMALVGFFKPILQKNEGPKVALSGLDSTVAAAER